MYIIMKYLNIRGLQCVKTISNIIVVLGKEYEYNVSGKRQKLFIEYILK